MTRSRTCWSLSTTSCCCRTSSMCFNNQKFSMKTTTNLSSSPVSHVYVHNHVRQQVSKVILQKATSPSCHPSRLRMDSSDLDPHLIHGFLDSDESAPKRHLDWFSPYPCDTQTDRHTDHATCDICSNKPHLMRCIQAMRPKNREYNCVTCSAV